MSNLLKSKYYTHVMMVFQSKLRDLILVCSNQMLKFLDIPAELDVPAIADAVLNIINQRGLLIQPAAVPEQEAEAEQVQQDMPVNIVPHRARSTRTTRKSNK